MIYEEYISKIARIEEIQADQERDRNTIAWIEAGRRHFDEAGTVDITDQVFAERVAHFEMLEELVWLWSQPYG